MIRLYNHGTSPCCEARVRVYTRMGKVSKIRCNDCWEKLDPLDVVDPSPYLMRKICLTGSTN